MACTRNNRRIARTDESVSVAVSSSRIFHSGVAWLRSKLAITDASDAP